MTDEVARLRALATQAADRQREFDADIKEVKSLAGRILHILPQDAGIASASLMAAFVSVAKGADEYAPGAGAELMGTAIHHLMVETLEMRASDG